MQTMTEGADLILEEKMGVGKIHMLQSSGQLDVNFNSAL